MNTKITLNDVLNFLASSDITREQHSRIVETINARVARTRKTVMNSLSRGDVVRWHSKYGSPMTGTVTGLGRTRVYVTGNDGMRWSVSATLLTKI